MPEFTAKDVQSLRQSTGVGMADAKRALEQSGGVMEDAIQWLRVNGLASAAKRSDREASQGAISVAQEGDAVAVVELRCETDFVAKSEQFVGLADELARLVAAKGEASLSERQDAVENLIVTLKENISVGRVVRLEAGPGQVIDSYLHLQAGRGINAVVVVLEGGTKELAHDVAAHAAFTRPAYVRREDVPESEIAAERATVEEISRNEGKPEAALPKIVEGRMNGWFKDRVLVEQSYVRDEKQTIAELIAPATVAKFEQVVIGG